MGFPANQMSYDVELLFDYVQQNPLSDKHAIQSTNDIFIA